MGHLHSSLLFPCAAPSASDFLHRQLALWGRGEGKGYRRHVPGLQGLPPEGTVITRRQAAVGPRAEGAQEGFRESVGQLGADEVGPPRS